MTFDSAPSLSKLEEELRKSRAEVLQATSDRELAQKLLSDFLSYHPGLAFIKDEQGRYLYANGNFARFFGVNVADIIGKTDFDWLPNDLAVQFTENDRIVRSTGKPLEAVESVPHTSGIVRSLVNKFPITDNAGGRLVGGTAIDISDRVAMEEELRADQSKLTAAIEATQKLLAHADKILGAFVNGEVGPLMAEQEKILQMLSHRIREFLSVFQSLPRADGNRPDSEALTQTEVLTSGP